MKFALIVIVVLILVVLAFAWAAMSMPGRSHRGALAPATDAQRALADVLRRDVEALCAVSPRSVFVRDNLKAAANIVERELTRAGYTVERQTFASEGETVANLIVEIPGTTKRDEIVVIGAHYDTVDETIGADDNGSGVAALFALARRFAKTQPARTLRFVAFANEEPPHFKTKDMGSLHYARRCKERRENVVAMLSLETMGYYDARPSSQHYPPPLSSFYPSEGNFIGFAANLGSRALLTQCVASFRRHADFPAEGAALPEVIQEIGWSDQWSFWQFGYRALMVTDTAPFRNPHYHRPSDKPHTLDYESLARVVEGLEGVVRDLTSAGA